MNKKVTLQDVADAAGCSKSTVSFVLNNKKGISDDTRKRVLKACKELNYGKMDIYPEDSPITLCLLDIVLDPSISEYNLFEFKSFYLKGVQKRCHELNINLESITLYELTPEAIQKAFDSIDGLSGVIVLGADLQKENDFLHFAGFPFPLVFIDTFYPSLPYDFINIDNTSGIFLLIKHLMSYNHEMIGLISIDSINFNILKRKEAFLSSAQFNDLIVKDNWVFSYHLNRDSDLDGYIHHLIETNNLPTAFICTTDLIPIQLFPIFAKYGITVPNDISVVTYGDLNISRIIRPKLTVIDPPKNQIGRAAVELIHNRLDKYNAPESLGYVLNPERVLVSNNLMIRESSKKI